MAETNSIAVPPRVKDPWKWTHGKSRTAEYECWKQIIQRCTNRNFKQYKDYGGRGITICERWRHSFEYFLMDMGQKPTPQHTIERINNNGNYEPGNCRWATTKEQSRNKRNTVLLTFLGRTQCVVTWAEEMGMPLDRLKSRLRLGWSVERALTTPPRHCRTPSSSAAPSL